MPAKRPGPAAGPIHGNLLPRLVSAWQRQSRLRQASFVCAVPGSLAAIHDFHHYGQRLGPSTLFLGAAILLFLAGTSIQTPRKP